MKKRINLEIKKTYELNTGTLLDKVEQIEDIHYLYLTGYEEKKLLIFKIPMMRKNCWERPYYFKITAKELIKTTKK